MEKLGQTIKHSIDEVSVPKEKLEWTVNGAISNAKMQRKRPRKQQQFMMGIASLLMIGVVSILFSNIVLTGNDNGIKGTFATIGDERLQKVAEEGLTETVNKVIENNNMTFTINETYYDSSMLAISFSLSIAEEAFEHNNEIPFQYIDAIINGERFGFSIPFSFTRDSNVFEDVLVIEQVKDFPEVVSIDVAIPELADGGVKSSDELVTVEVTKNKEETIKDVYAKSEHEEDRFIVEQVSITPSQVTVTAKTQQIIEDHFDDFKLNQTYGVVVVGQEEDGFVYQWPQLFSVSTYKDYSEVTHQYASYQSEIRMSKDSGSNHFYIVPYSQSEEKIVKQMQLKHGEKITINDTSMEIVKVEDTETETVITMEVTNKMRHFPFQMMHAYDKSKDELYQPLYFSQPEDGVMKLAYPKIENKEDALIYMQNITLYDELGVEVNLE